MNINNYFRIEGMTTIKRNGEKITILFCNLRKEIQDFSDLIDHEVILNFYDQEKSGVYKVKGVEHHMHAPPYREGEKIGLHVEKVEQ